MGQFHLHEKTKQSYLDQAANGSGVDKCELTVDALQRLRDPQQGRQAADIIEIGPGGGVALEALTNTIKTQFPEYIGGLSLKLVELDGVESESLHSVRQQFHEIGESTFHIGDAREIDTLIGENSSDIVVACAVFHEVYSYGGGYPALQDAFKATNRALREGGFMAYRDIVSIPGRSLLERTREEYDAESWVRFASMFLPYYLNNAQHPYAAEESYVSFEQESKIIPAEDVDPSRPVVIDAPIGVFRELQRHYITFRDQAWRSDVFEVTPVLDSPLARDWIDESEGHKRIHFRFNSDSVNGPLDEVEDTDGHGNYVVDCDIFDPEVDIFLANFLSKATDSESEQGKIWKQWLDREGPETYVYYTLDHLIGSVAVSTLHDTSSSKVLLPQRISVAPRAYYTRYLKRNLPNGITDGGQQVLFQAIDPHAQPHLVNDALNHIAKHCSPDTLDLVYDSITKA